MRRCANSNTFGSTCVISAIRITSLRATLTDADVTWTAVDTALWSMGEATCAIICVCIPTLRPLVTGLDRLWRRQHRTDESMKYKDSTGRWGKQLSDDTGHPETQPHAYALMNVDDEHMRGDISLDSIIPKPSSCYLSTSRV